MDLKKIGLLAVFAILMTGIVVYESQYTRHRAPSSPSVAGNPASAPAAVPQSATPVVLPVVPIEGNSEVAQPAVPAVTLSIPKRGWGRNPFLSVEEIAKLREPVKPAEPVPVETPVVTFPLYTVSSIVTNDKGGWAVIDSRVLRVGDRIGIETVKEITAKSIVLETGGKTRKLGLGSGTVKQVQAPKG